MPLEIAKQSQGLWSRKSFGFLGAKIKITRLQNTRLLRSGQVVGQAY